MTNFEFTSCIPDLLHLFLRITGKLIELIVEEINIKDTIDKSDQSEFKKFVKLIEDSFNITHLSKVDGGKLILRSLNGKDKLAIFRGLSLKNDDFLENSLPGLREIKKIQRLWKNFYNTLEDVKDERKRLDYTVIKDKTEKWLLLFLEVNFI